MRTKTTIAALAALLSAGACTTTTAPLPQAAPASFVAKSAGTAVSPSTQWWKSFRDAGLDAAVSASLSTGLTVAAAVERVAEARASAGAAYASSFPVLDGTLAASRSRGGVDARAAGLQASWEADLFGGQAARRAAADAGVEASEESLNAARLALVSDVASAYVDARGYRSRAEIARATLSLQEQTLGLTRTKADAGAASGLDVVRAQGLVADTRATLPGLDAQADAAEVRLSILSGRELASTKAALRGKGGIPSFSGKASAGAPADLLRNRPDVRRAEADLRAAAAEAGVSEAALYPSLRISGNVGLNAATVAKLASSQALVWSFGPTLDLPILDGGLRRANLEAARSRVRQAEIAYRAAVQQAVGEVETAFVDLRSAVSRRSSLEASARSYREALSMSRTLYEAGSGEFIDVLDAERSVQSSRDATAQNAVAVAQAYVSVNRALGGGWAAGR